MNDNSTMHGIMKRSVKATFHLTIYMSGQRATGKIKRIITIKEVAGLL